MGQYGTQLRRYFNVFPREQILILDNEDLRRRRIETLNRVLRHIGLQEWDWSVVDLSDVFSGNDGEEMPRQARAFLREHYAASNRMLTDFMDPLPEWAREPAKLRIA
jgi:hypothetical protein